MSGIKWVVVERQNMSGRFVALRGLSWKSEAEAKAHIVEKFNPRFHSRYHVESRADKASDAEQRMHCQCCGRSILAKLGRIAHHGYERPGHGWQSPSCMGAKRLPFEVDRDALGEMIGFLRDRLARAEKHRAAIKAEKLPIVFHYESQMIGPQRYARNRWDKWPVVKREFEISRESFDEFKEGPGRNSSYGLYDFDSYKASHVEGLSRSINNLKEHIDEEQKRFDGWKQSHEWKDGQWAALAPKRKKEKA